MTISLRTARASDLEFCRSLHHLGLRQYVEPLWGWDPQFQDKRFIQKFDPAYIKIIQISGREIGYLETTIQGSSLNVENCILEPKSQGKGLGTQILTEVIDKAPAEVLKVTLNVLCNNPARRLYERLGFKQVGEQDSVLSFELTL